MANKKMNPDGFSHLPDHILSLILSFLPFVDAARVSIVSKRWLHIWRTSSVVEFDESFFVEEMDYCERKFGRWEFIKFVRKWMVDYGGHVVEKFRLSFSDPQDHWVDMLNCISFAISHGVKVLVLDFSDRGWYEGMLPPYFIYFELPAFVYRHKGLESLKLVSCQFQASEFGNFSALKDLFLGWIGLDSSSLKEVLLNCSLLVSLCLQNCWISDDFDVSGPDLKLQRLVIDKCYVGEQIKIAAKKLRFLKYSGSLKIFFLDDQPSVEEAQLEFSLNPEFDNDGVCGDILQNLLRELYPKTLTVCSYMLMELPHGPEKSGLRPYLEALQHLTVKTSMDPDELSGISFLLESCPSLQMLTVDLSPAPLIDVENLGLFQDFNLGLVVQNQQFYGGPPRLFRCVRETLKVVEINSFKGDPDEIEMLKYLLLHGRVMERLIIRVDEDSDAADWAQNLKNFVRASPALQIFVSP